MNRSRSRSAAIALLCCLVPGAAAARTHRTRHVKPTVWPREARRFPAAPVEWPRREVLDLAMQAYRCGRAEGQFATPILTLIDYSLPSTEKRLWVIDLEKRRVLFHELVAHGQNSGEAYAVAFSNRPQSRQSSLGLFRTDAVYDGRHGESLRLIGLEPGINDRADERRIVMHGAAYVNPRVVQRFGQLGRSWGCPAVDRTVLPKIVQQIKEGTALFAYYPDPNWLQQSHFLQCDPNLAAK
ncbi:MAG TPA: murein L,D-transpeptidase catalytic domain family protein [Candidatus Binatia bacterium]|nr:murein L,D-transpeptidase catalytic domain family protein [Candidatus Binatia bacterium]